MAPSKPLHLAAKTSWLLTQAVSSMCVEWRCHPWGTTDALPTADHPPQVTFATNFGDRLAAGLDDDRPAGVVFAALPNQETMMTTHTAARCCAAIELRQYTLKPGQRDVLIDLFEREFVETQETVGMLLVGQFRDLDRPDRFVWIRGFPDMASRAQSLQAFYGGPVWQAHREAANATMIDSDNVLLLRPVSADSAFAPSAAVRAPAGAAERSSAIIVATICYFDAPVGEPFKKFFDAEIAPELAAAGGAPIARFETEPAENTFPRLPIRTGEHVFVWFARFANDAALHEHEARLAASSHWTTQLLPELLEHLKSPPERLLLEPTARSLLR